jgi:hypothetical protein
MKFSLGRYVFGLATIATGICALASHNYDQLAAVPHHAILSYIVAAIEILAGRVANPSARYRSSLKAQLKLARVPHPS